MICRLAFKGIFAYRCDRKQDIIKVTVVLVYEAILVISEQVGTTHLWIPYRRHIPCVLAVRFPVVGLWTPTDVKQMDVIHKRFRANGTTGYRRPPWAADARPPRVGRVGWCDGTSRRRTGVAAEELASTARAP